ncbi:Cobalamin (vitamin B12) biosynthesis CbiB, partial [mine drainage metagenome]
VGRSLASGDLAVARILLGKIVGRDTQQLAEPEIARAALESLSENLTDAVVAPLFFLFLGGAPLLIFYKAVSTMDSQVGYKNAFTGIWAGQVPDWTIFWPSSPQD